MVVRNLARKNIHNIIRNPNTFESIISKDGWSIEDSGHYFSSGQRKEYKDVICLTRRTKIEDFLQKSSRHSSRRAQNYSALSTGANNTLGSPIGAFAPVENRDNRLPALSSFENYQSMIKARSNRDTLLIGFDTEWDGDNTLSWQFSCIVNIELIEIIFICLAERNLSLDYCLGWICDYINLNSIDIRTIVRYSYCDKWDNDHPVVTVTKNLDEARTNARYVFRDGSYTKEIIANMPDRFEKKTNRDWSWFHMWHDFKSCKKIPVTIVCHTGRVDMRNFGSDEGVSIFRFCNNVQGGLVTIKYPINCHPKSLMINNSHVAHVYPLSLCIRDTMCHTPSNSKSLEALGEVIGIEKIELDKEIKSHMADLLGSDPCLYLNYASRDSVVTMLYASAMYGYNKEMPITLTAAAANVARKYMMDYLGCKSTEEFNMKYRGLVKVSHGLAPRNDRPGYLENTSLEPLSDKVNTIQYYCTQAYHGGYNGSSFIGYFPNTITYDYDLKNAYSTANSLVPDVDWSDPIGNELINHQLKLTDFIINQFTGQINPIPLFVMYGSFKFPKHVKFPCLPITVDGIPIFPLSSDGINGVYLMGPEVVLALKLGAEIFCERGFFIKPLLRKDGSVSYSLQSVNYQLVNDRARAKEEIYKGCIEEQSFKTMCSCIYGKNAQNVVNKSSWSAYSQEMEDLGASAITNPFSAALTTSIVRAELLAVQNQCINAGYNTYSVTTDGGLFDCPENVMKSFDLYGLKPFLAKSRLFLTDGKDPEIWEVKHAQDDLLNFCRRGNTSQYSEEHPFTAPNGKKYPGVNAHNQTKSGEWIDESKNEYKHYDSDSPEDRKWLFEQVVTRTGPVRYYTDEWTGFKEQSLGEKFKVTKNKYRDVRMDFDFSRKPIRKSFYPVNVCINNQSYEIACFETEPYDNIEEFRKYRKKYKLTNVLRTMNDWSVFWLKLDLNSCGAKPRNFDFSILMSIVMGYRSGKFIIPKLDECSSVSEKIEYINKHNSSGKKFTLNNWKDARKPSRQSNMLPDEFLQEKLDELTKS